MVDIARLLLISHCGWFDFHLSKLYRDLVLLTSSHVSCKYHHPPSHNDWFYPHDSCFPVIEKNVFLSRFVVTVVRIVGWILMLDTKTPSLGFHLLKRPRSQTNAAGNFSLWFWTIPLSGSVSLVGWNTNILVPFRWGFHHPNWLSFIFFQRGRCLNHQPAMARLL